MSNKKEINHDKMSDFCQYLSEFLNKLTYIEGFHPYFCQFLHDFV